MDSFDDLLASSSRALEDNPFADPFANTRPSSPDPWATFGQQPRVYDFPDEHNVSHVDTDENGPGEDSGPSTTDVPFDDSFSGRDVAPVHATPDPEAASNADAVSTNGSGPQSPGFRESVPIDEPPSASDVEELPKIPLSDDMKSSTLLSDRASAHSSSLETATHQITPPEHGFSPPLLSSSAQPGAFVSPLDYSSPGISQSFASLALGGESAGGWQDSQPAPSSLPEQSTTSATTDSHAEIEPVPPPSERKESISIGEPRMAQPLFSICVDDPQKVGDAIRPYILYTVHTKTTLPSFNKPSFSVLRRYSDFLWLYETLSMNNPGVIVPPVPEKSSFGRFDNLFVQQRRLALEKCIQKIANHPVLAKDADLKMFLESDTFALDIRHRKIEITQERGGIMSSIGQTIAGPKFYEVDDWFDKKKSYLDGLESQLRGLIKSIDSVSKQRAELAIAIGEFALAIGELSESDLSKQLSHSLVVMSDVEKKAQDTQHTQAQEDTTTFMSTAEEYARIINSVRMAFASRVRCHAQWQTTEVELRRVKQAHEKARSQGRIHQDRLGHSLAQIADAERRVLDAKQGFEHCSKLIKSEMARFEEERIHDFKSSLEAFLGGMIQRQKQLIASWESYQDILLKKANVAQHPTRSDGKGEFTE
ncbi:hypothetical protein M0805_006892 [Coniferiporia weirii]|nr:hypothetical protein M0805_006892 [Coniferiporia weirii]